MALTISLRGMFGFCTFGCHGGRRFVDFNVDLILLGMSLFSTLVFCAIVLVGSLLSFLYTLSERKFFIFFLSSNVFMTIAVLPLSAGSMMMSVSLFRSWKANCSCLVMFGEGDLALERILVTCLRISACSDGCQ